MSWLVVFIVMMLCYVTRLCFVDGPFLEWTMTSLHELLIFTLYGTLNDNLLYQIDCFMCCDTLARLVTFLWVRQFSLMLKMSCIKMLLDLSV